ncbi:unnamed protein product [Lepeophtheirus salmonis]|uniref:(salmon louse) hypothetical protein n=1 Tax=Lepeophtheirus salmonis TaxID=72036 RepID=A0A7R8CK46_LEPSM|nr:unnamed protein product [Lepeophtheirus salmonis]CAF2846874.1 unnamed protein product [Lepeophtheirus salmonis]
MFDRFCSKNKEDFENTFFINNRNRVVKSSRLDYVFLSPNLASNINQCKIIPPKQSDYKPILVTINYPPKHVKKTWKLNVSLLEDDQTDAMVREIIMDIKLKLQFKIVKTAFHALKLMLDCRWREYIKLGISKSEEKKRKKLELEELSISEYNTTISEKPEQFS